jgi:hypothetical protein
MSEHKRVEELEPRLDLSQLSTSYANWYQVTGTPEEMIIDFGVTANLGIVTGDPVRVNRRLVMSFYTAKRLLTHLHYAVKRYENAFGPLEIDIPTRMQNLSAARKAA